MQRGMKARALLFTILPPRVADHTITRQVEMATKYLIALTTIILMSS
jgi:hypothetical protein